MRRSKGIFFIALVIPAILSLIAEGHQIQKRDADGKQYTYNVNGKKVTLDFPVFLEGDDKKVTKDVFHGYQLYNSYCYRCHGTDATESSLAPDLRRFTAILPQKNFQSVVMAGRE